MSWQAYVDTNLLGSGKVAQAAIIGLQGGVWARSAGLNVSAEEEKAILKAHTNTEQTQANGVRVGGQKYLTLQVNERSIYGKKAADGIVLVKTKQAILVCVYIAPTQAGEANKVVEELADYLISVGY